MLKVITIMLFAFPFVAFSQILNWESEYRNDTLQYQTSQFLIEDSDGNYVTASTHLVEGEMLSTINMIISKHDNAGIIKWSYPQSEKKILVHNHWHKMLRMN